MWQQWVVESGNMTALCLCFQLHAVTGYLIACVALCLSYSPAQQCYVMLLLTFGVVVTAHSASALEC